MYVVVTVSKISLYIRLVLFGQWGFGATEQQGITVLLHGAPGTGKSLASEAIGYEVGKALKVSVCRTSNRRNLDPDFA